MGMKHAIFALVALACATPAGAEMVSAKDPQTLVRALQGAGFQAKLDKDKIGDPMITSAYSGSTFVIYFYGCKNNVGCATIQFVTSYDSKDGAGPPLEKINAWNLNQRFGNAFIDKEGDPVLNMDLDLDDGGMSSALFTDNLEFWTAVMAGFEKHIGW